MFDDIFFVDAHEGAPELDAQPGETIHFVNAGGAEVAVLVVRIEGCRIYFRNKPPVH